MPKIRLTGPNGEVKTVSVSEIPNESQLQEIISTVFQQTPNVQSKQSFVRPESQPIQRQGSFTQEATQPPVSNGPTGSFFLDVQKQLESNRPLATSLELSRDIQEERNRPGLGQFIGEAATSAKQEISNLFGLASTFAKNPIQSSKKSKKLPLN